MACLPREQLGSTHAGRAQVRRRHGSSELGGLSRRRQRHGVSIEPRQRHRLTVGGPPHRRVMHAHHRAARLAATKLRRLQVDVAGEVCEGRREPEKTAPAAHLVRASGKGQGQG